MAETTVVADRSRRAKGWVGIIFGTIFGGFGTAFLVGVTLAAIANPDPLFLILLGMGGIFAVGGAVAVIVGVRKLWLSHLFGVPTLTLPSAQPLCLGGLVEARFQRVGGAQRAQRAPLLKAELVGHERVTYRQGTDDHTVTQEIHRRKLTVTSDQVPGTVSGRVMIQVPVDVPPSMKLRNNQIQWSVQVRVRVPGVPDDTGTFPVEILPVVAGHKVGDGGSTGLAAGGSR